MMSTGLVRSNVEDFLLDHSDVMDASLVEEKGSDGRDYRVAYVVPHPERVREGKKRAREAEAHKRTAHWQKAFDRIYHPFNGNHAPSFVGWVSSYTNKPIAETEMQEWITSTVERIAALRPNRVLEIGCGVGLLTQALASGCESYRGTDLSEVAIARLRMFVATKPELEHVELLQAEAADFSAQPPGSVDTVIINSVIQYFPDLDYLRHVIEGAARAVIPGGHLFIGDVRHLGMLTLFQSAVQFSKAPSNASIRWLKQKIRMASDQERELLIEPAYFHHLTDFISGIETVEILPKRGRFHNEMTGYRYDVVIHMAEARPSPSPERTRRWADDVAMLEALARPEAAAPAPTGDGAASNLRFTRDLVVHRHIEAADDSATVESVRNAVLSTLERGLEPEDLDMFMPFNTRDASGERSPRAARCCATSTMGGGGEVARLPFGEVAGAAPSPARRRMATDPLEAAFLQGLGLDLFQQLSDRLPEASLPAAVFAVHKMPANARPTFPCASGRSSPADDGLAPPLSTGRA